MTPQTTTNWQEVAVYLGMIYFIGKLLWDIIIYFLKKKDGLTDTDHEAIHSIKISITEIREAIKSMGADVASIKRSLLDIDNRTDLNEEDIRNIQEALRTTEIHHMNQHKQALGLAEILQRKIKK